MSIADRIKAHQDQYGLSQPAMAEVLGVSERTVFGWRKEEPAAPKLMEKGIIEALEIDAAKRGKKIAKSTRQPAKAAR